MRGELEITLLHKLPGRLRLRLSEPPQQLERFERAIRAHKGFESLSFSPISKSLLIHYQTDHLSLEEILVRCAIALSMEYGSEAVRVDPGENQEEAMTKTTIFAGLMLLTASAMELSGVSRASWYARGAGLTVAAAVIEHGWLEAHSRGYIDPELLSIGYLMSSWHQEKILRGATVTWLASFGRHLFSQTQKYVEVRPGNRQRGGNEAKTYQVSLLPRQPAAPLLRFAQGFFALFGMGDLGEGENSLYQDIKTMAQAHDRVLEGLEIQPGGIPLTFTKEL